MIVGSKLLDNGLEFVPCGIVFKKKEDIKSINAYIYYISITFEFGQQFLSQELNTERNGFLAGISLKSIQNIKN